MRRFIYVFATAILALGIASAQTTPLVVKAKAGQTTFVQISQPNDIGRLGPELKLIRVGISDPSTTDLAERFQALDEGIPGGWKVFVSSSEFTHQKVPQSGIPTSTLYNNFVANTYGITIPRGVSAGLYKLELSIRDANNGDVALIPISVEVVL